MLFDASTLNAIVALVLVAPPVFDPTDSTVRRLRSNGIQLYGRDPCEGTGLHCARLPVYASGDVDAVFLPCGGYRLGDLRALSLLHNVRYVRSNRSLTERQYRVLNESLPKTVWLSFNVRMNDGTLERLGSHHRRYRDAHNDINGDGVIDEHDGADLRVVESDPPRIEIGK